jgi:hypothetical protein
MDETTKPELCKVCDGPVNIQIRKGSGTCCTICEKVAAGELPADRKPVRSDD